MKRRFVPALRLVASGWWWIAPVLIATPILWWLAAEADDALVALYLLWTWTGGSGLGFLVSLALVHQTWLEAQSLRERRKVEKTLRLIADANMRREIFRTVEFLALLIIGLSILSGNAIVFLTRFLLVLVVALLFGNTILDLQERRQTSAVLRQAIRNREHDDQRD